MGAGVDLGGFLSGLTGVQVKLTTRENAFHGAVLAVE